MIPPHAAKNSTGILPGNQMNFPETPAFLSKNLRYFSLFIGLAVLTAFQIARQTAFNVHPDEFVHADAFCYFENHWWPPDLNSDGLVYSPYGWSRVYSGELVYLLYGRLSRLIRSVSPGEISAAPAPGTPVGEQKDQANLPPGLNLKTCQNRAEDNALIYRLLNVLLYLVTLLVLFYAGRKWLWALLVGLLLLAIPQVIYVYSYANSDAWGLSISIFLFLFVLTRSGALFNSWRNFVGLGALTGLVLLSKETFWASLPFSYLLVVWSFWKERLNGQPVPLRRTAANLAVLTLTAFLVFSPLAVIYPLSQGDFNARAEQMREARAGQAFKPSHPTAPGYRLAERGFPFRRIGANQRWVKLSVQSLYGRFGYLSIKPQLWLYNTVLALFLLLALMTYGFLVLRRHEIPPPVHLALIFAPLCIIAVILASMYNSWTVDFQPQGRYLFAALLPLAVISGGAAAYEPRWLRVLRLLIWFALYCLCLYVLWFMVLGEPRLLAAPLH
jgi:hypothetical protein